MSDDTENPDRSILARAVDKAGGVSAYAREMDYSDADRKRVGRTVRGDTARVDARLVRDARSFLGERPPGSPPPGRRTEAEWETDALASGQISEPALDYGDAPLIIDGVYCPYFVPDGMGRPLFGLTAGYEIVPIRSAVISRAPVAAGTAST